MNALAGQFRDIPRYLVAFLIRSGSEFLFAAEGGAGPKPFTQVITTDRPLHPAIGSESLLRVVQNAAGPIGLDVARARSFEILPSDTLRPFQDTTIYSVIVEVDPEQMDQLRQRHPQAILITANFILQHVATNIFFRGISESYRVGQIEP